MEIKQALNTNYLNKIIPLCFGIIGIKLDNLTA